MKDYCKHQWLLFRKRTENIQSKQLHIPLLITNHLLNNLYPHHFVNFSFTTEPNESRPTYKYLPTQSGLRLIYRDHCVDPGQIRCQSTKLPSFPPVAAV